MKNPTLGQVARMVLRDDSKDAYFLVKNIETGKETKYDEGSLYLMLGGDSNACDKVNKYARSGKLLNNKFLIKKITTRS